MNSNKIPFRVGTKLGSKQQFIITKNIFIPELKLPLLELIHEPTGANVLYIPNNDSENFFCLSFQTLPESSNGVAHILEHTVLCGSKKFPLRDPFFCMQRRSLNTFLNAFTGADFTCFPAASQVPKDFYNLLEVYLDAVFFPLLSKMSFRQEGHRLEFENPEDSSTPIQRKGIVYNEMKGALNSPMAILHEMMDHYLFPTTAYGYNSGGDPKEIPHLTYEELLEFHRKFYHPSQCLFFFYGDLPLEEHLEFLEKHTFENCQKYTGSILPKLEVRYKSPVKEEGEYPIFSETEEGDLAFVAFGWLTCNIHKQEEALALNILDMVLMETDASPLKKALQHSGLCKQAVSTIEDDKRELPYLLTLKGCPLDSQDTIEKFLFDTLQEIVKQGISRESIENAMHQLEFERSEISGDHYPFGLMLFMRSALLKQHGVDPENGLTVHEHFKKLRRKLEEDPHYFENLLQKYLIENPHFVRIILRPNPNLAEEEQEEEKELLKKLKEEFDESEKLNLIEQAKRLKEYQESPEEDLMQTLPKIYLSDVPEEVKEYSLQKEEIGNWKIFRHETFTNGIVYLDAHFPLTYVEKSDLAYLSLFAHFFTQFGAGDRNYLETLNYIQAHTGGVAACLSLFIQAENHKSFIPQFILRGKVLEPKSKFLFTLFSDFFRKVDFSDRERMKELLNKHYIALETQVNKASMRYASQLSTSTLSFSSWLHNEWYGLPYFYKIQEIMKDIDNFLPILEEKFRNFHEHLFNQKESDLVISCYQDTYQEIKREKFFGLLKNQKKEATPFEKENFSFEELESQGRTITSPVSFIAKSFETISYSNPHSPYLSIASCLFDNITLHSRIREQGGAYGGGAASNPISGIFSFYSYRDPHLLATVEAFDEAVNTIAQGHFTEQQLEEAKLEIIQAFDNPISPGSRGALAYQWRLQGKTVVQRQTFRERVLKATKKEIIDSVKKFVSPKMEESPIVVFASKEFLEKENLKFEEKGKKPLTIYPVT